MLTTMYFRESDNITQISDISIAACKSLIDGYDYWDVGVNPVLVATLPRGGCVVSIPEVTTPAYVLAELASDPTVVYEGEMRDEYATATLIGPTNTGSVTNDFGDVNDRLDTITSYVATMQGLGGINFLDVDENTIQMTFSETIPAGMTLKLYSLNGNGGNWNWWANPVATLDEFGVTTPAGVTNIINGPVAASFDGMAPVPAGTLTISYSGQMSGAHTFSWQMQAFPAGVGGWLNMLMDDGTTRDLGSWAIPLRHTLRDPLPTLSEIEASTVIAKEATLGTPNYGSLAQDIARADNRLMFLHSNASKHLIGIAGCDFSQADPWTFSGIAIPADATIDIYASGTDVGSDNTLVYSWTGGAWVKQYAGGTPGERVLSFEISVGATPIPAGTLTITVNNSAMHATPYDINIRFGGMPAGGYMECAADLHGYLIPHWTGRLTALDRPSLTEIEASSVLAKEETSAEILAAMGASGDIWEEVVPGAYSPGSAGYVLGTLGPVFAHLTAMHEAGTILVPTPVLVGNTISLHRQASYSGLMFTLGPQWSPYLDGTYDIYFSAKKYYTDPNTRFLWDVVMTVVDQATGTVSVNLSVDDTDHPIRAGWWMIQARKVMTPPTDPPDDVKPMMEGKLVLNPMVKKD